MMLWAGHQAYLRLLSATPMKICIIHVRFPVIFPDLDPTDNDADNGRYFSFPSFDMYEASQQEDDEKTEMKSP